MIVPFVIFKDIICADAATVYGWKKVKHKPKNNDFQGSVISSTGTIDIPRYEISEMDKQEAVEDNDPYSILSIFEIERITENTIEELPDQCKSIFKLSRINGLKNQEIADKLDISVRTVETQIYRALKILKSRLKDYLVS